MIQTISCYLSNPEQTLLLHLRFWRQLEFVITVKNFEKTDKLLGKPKLIAKSGKSPEQYPSWDEDNEEW